MWCSVCQSDVATEVGADNRRVSCSNCGHLLAGAVGTSRDQTSTVVPAARPETRAAEARQLLDRWAKGHFFDPYGPPRKIESAPVAPVATTFGPEEHGPEERRSVERSDDAPEKLASVSSDDARSDDARNIETIDERDFVAVSESPKAESPKAADEVKSSAQGSSVKPDAAAPAAKKVSSEEVVAVDNEPEAITTASAAAAAASSAELDRLTREIMARVSKITEARAEASAATDMPSSEGRPTTDDHTSVAAGMAASFPTHEVSPPRQVSAARSDSGNHDDLHSRAMSSAFDEPVPSRTETSRRTDATHQPSRNPEPVSTPVSASQTPAQTSPGGWYNNIGQMLAYLGIICLTAGTCGVIVSYFGGPANYAPYGWLGATIGQMLLFLGIVTLISAGMEQTSQELRQAVDQRMDEVTQRLDQIGNRIMRIEEANLDGPPRPHLLSQPEQERRRAESATPRATRDA
tara:strand:- start:141644 stop:143035 length:1392 start_codon:yes stop_codon:yes gene_type:complete